MKKILQNKQLRFLLIVALVLISGVGIAYAIFQTTLTVTFNKVTQNAITWDIGFDTTGSPISASVGGTSATGRSCGTATLTANSVTVADTSISKPGDKCTYTLTIKNNGTVTGTLATITATNPTVSPSGSCSQSGASITCGKVKYALTTNNTGTTLLTTGGALAANETLTIYLVISYVGDTAQTTAVTQTGATFTLTYNG